MNATATNRLYLALLLVVLGVVLRLLPHPWNLTPIGAIALFSGAAFDRKRWSFAIPIAAMFIGDVLMEITTGYGLHSLMPVVYGSFAASVVIGLLIRARRGSAKAVAGAAVVSSVLFYVVTNFAMWTISTVYPKTMAGLIACYVAGIPYFGTQLAGDLLYSALLFGTFVQLERRLTRFAPAPA